MLNIAVCILGLLSFTTSTRAQSLQIPGEQPTGRVVLTGATVHTMTNGTIDSGYVAFENGVIQDVGEGDYTGPAAQLINARTLHVYPGLFSPASSIGLIEIESIRATRDQSEVGQWTPEVVALTAVNPDSAIIPVTRANGILTTLVVPSGGTVSGYASLIRLDGWTTEDLEIVRRLGLVIRWPNMRSRSRWGGGGQNNALDRAEETIHELDELLAEARAYLAARSDDSIDQPIDLRLESLAPVIEGETPVIVVANDLPQIQSAVSWCDRQGFRMILAGAEEADQCLDLLHEQDIPIIVGEIHRMPTRRDAPYDEPFTLPKKLNDAGIRFCIAGGLGEASNERNLPYHAAQAAAYGLPPDIALKAITSYPAAIFGVDDQLGSIEKGKIATIILTTGNPLEISTNTIAAWINGAPVDLGSKQKSLNRKYRIRYGLPFDSN